MSYYDAAEIKERLQYRYAVGQVPERDGMEYGSFFCRLPSSYFPHVEYIGFFTQNQNIGTSVDPEPSLKILILMLRALTYFGLIFLFDISLAYIHV